jgi:hypothetical protein
MMHLLEIYVILRAVLSEIIQTWHIIFPYDIFFYLLHTCLEDVEVFVSIGKFLGFEFGDLVLDYLDT